MNPAVTYTPGDLIALRSASAIALIDDRAGPPLASSMLIAAINNGHETIVSLAAVGGADRAVPGFGVLSHTEDGWFAMVCGSVFAVVEPQEAGQMVASDDAFAVSLYLPASTSSVRFFQAESSASDHGHEQIELVGGTVRALDTTINVRSWTSELRQVDVSASTSKQKNRPAPLS